MRHLAAMLTVVLAAAPGPGQAEADDTDERSPGVLAAEGVGKLLEALDMFIQSIPQYEPPVITDDGDIIIRRKRESAPEPLPVPLPRRGDGARI